ncbi:M24 family metallopeptidase, partial [bacterium]|nr:M24 family metallopeptidase [bacterium]
MIIIKSWSEIKKMQKGGRIAHRTIELIKEAAYPGITTLELDKLAVNFLKKNKARPAFLGYKNYPATLCTSVNDQVVHGIPGSYRLK